MTKQSLLCWTNLLLAADAALSSRRTLSLAWAIVAENRLYIDTDAILERPSLPVRCGMLQADERMLATYISHRLTRKFAERDNPVWCKCSDLSLDYRARKLA